MAGQSSSLAVKPHALWKPALFFLVLIIGLWYVKWFPSYGKFFVVAGEHSAGKSILADAGSDLFCAALDYALVYFLAVWKAAVLGVILGSLVQVLVPRDWLMRTLGQRRFSGTLYGALFSLPGMMCSCCAAPVTAGMRRQSISVGGALAFWMGNPLLNPATLVFMGFVLGWNFVFIRLIAGFCTVAGVALLVQRYTEDDMPRKVDVFVRKSQPQARFMVRWASALWMLCRSTIPVYILAVMAMGAARVWLFPVVDAGIDNSLPWVVAMAVAGCLFVIPTAAEIPIIQTMMLAGMGEAPALALMITLPAVSLPSLLMLRGSFPGKALWLTGALVTLCGIFTGSLALL